ncbi:hypothetical protein [Wolbachia endosymbiont (group A) of Ennomos erosarius]|uniref:hypothetical protein n=1 Tax=Wolbachia endosymbiont (group A) of Ennomos erosarius TaxID=3066174 RepID=UPI00333E6E89
MTGETLSATGFALVELDRKEYRSSARPDEQTLFERFLLRKTKQELISIITRSSKHYPEIFEELEDKEYEQFIQSELSKSENYV